MQSFKTHVLDDLRVQGRFNQDGLVIGRGISEQLVFQTGYAEEGVITYTLSGCGYASVNATFYRRADLDSTLNAGCDSFFGEKEVDRPSFALFHDGNKNCWCLEEFNGTSAGHVTPMYQTNEDTLDENSTWQYNMGPSPAPTTVVKHEVPGKVAPAIRFTPGVEGASAKLEITNDGINWISVAGGGGSVTYEPITFTASDLSAGKLTIQHNFGRANILCLDSVPKPKGIEYGLNEVVLDFSDQAADVTGVVWFVGSEASMLTPPK